MLTERLIDNECLIIYGTERISTYTGYSYSFLWENDYIDTQSFHHRHSPRVRQNEIIAIDALHFGRSGGITHQVTRQTMNRELNKAYIGFLNHSDNARFALPTIATGNWGCGAFGGDKVLKFLIQWIAFSVSKRHELVYYTFGDVVLVECMERWIRVAEMKRVSVGTVVKALMEFGTVIKGSGDGGFTDLVEFLDATVFREYTEYNT
jgi:poly(ADP-ribose) glycohydrolase